MSNENDEPGRVDPATRNEELMRRLDDCLIAIVIDAGSRLDCDEPPLQAVPLRWAVEAGPAPLPALAMAAPATHGDGTRSTFCR